MRWPRELGVFAIEDEAVQLTWRSLGTGDYEIRIADHVLSFPEENRPGAITIGGLEPNTSYDAVVSAPAFTAPKTVRFTTLPRPPGAPLVRVGVVGDLHLGSDYFGFTRRIREPVQTDIPADRCAAAAIDEVERWGAERLFIKGDLVHRGTPSEWSTAHRLLANRSMPVEMTLGNHETSHPILVRDGVARLGASPISPVRFVDLPGVRVITVETADRHPERGAIGDRTAAVMEVAAAATTPVIVVSHHHLHQRALEVMAPRGVPRKDARPFLEQLGEVAPGAIVISGHAHRHRRYDVGSVTVVETGSTKDYPGTWTGFVVHQGGIRQVVRRIECPDCLAWTNRTRRAAFGVWRWWSPGRLEQRCFVKTWRDLTRLR